MSAIGMLGAGALESLLSNSTQSRFQKFKQDFQQLGQDLQSGNLSQARTDLAALQPGGSSSPLGTSPSGVVTQAFQQLAQDLRSGNLTAAQSDYTALQQNLKQGADLAHQFHLHASRANNTVTQTQAQQALSQLGQALQSGNLNAAQQAYTALQADTSLFGASSGGSSSGASVNLSA